MLLDVVMGEAAKTVTASLASSGIAGVGRLVRLVRGKTNGLPGDPLADPAAAVELLAACGRQDPGWAAEVAAELAARLDGPNVAIAAPPVPFCDRDALRARVPDAGVLLVAGQRGSGKTALVRQLAADVAARFPTGRCAVDLDLFRDGDVPRLAEAKRHVLRQLGVVEVSAAEPELSEQYLRAPLARRFVLVVENVLGAAEVRALVPGWPASLVLVTTRRLTDDLRAACPRFVELDGLDDAGALAMLAGRCGSAMLAAEPAAAWELLRRFGKLPYAIEQLGVVLGRRTGEQDAVSAVLAEFDAAGITETSELIANGLADSVALLPDAAAADYPLLAVHPGGEFTVASADALLGRPSRRTVDALHDVGLLVSAGPGRHGLHWFARRHAEELAQRRGVDTGPGFDRVLGYFAGRAVAADLAGGPRARYYRVPEVPAWPAGVDRIDWLDTERHVLADLVELAYLRGRHEEVGQLCGALEVLLLHRGRHELCLAAFDRGVGSAEALGRPALLARLHGLRGRVYTLLHMFDRAAAALDGAWRLVPAADDAELESSLWEFRGRLTEEQADVRGGTDYSAAVTAFTNAVEIDRRTGHNRALGLHARMLANVLVKAGRPGPALLLLAEAAANTADERNRSRVCTVRAKALVAQGEPVAAGEQIDEAIRLANASNAGQYGYELADVQAEIAFRLGDVGGARSRWGWLVQEYLNAGHPKSAVYLGKLNRLPPAPRP